MRNRTIAIAHVVGSLAKGGAERQVIELLNELDPRKFERHLIILRQNPNNFDYLVKPDVRCFTVHYRSRFFVAGLLRLVDYLKKRRIQIVHSHIYDPSKVAAVAARAAGVSVFMTTEHGKNLWKKWYHHAIERFLINRLATLRIAVSADIRQLRIDRDGTRPDGIVVIPNGTIVPEYTADTSRSPRIVGSLGRLVEPKDYRTLIQATTLARKQGCDLELEIAGQGPEGPGLQEFIDSIGMAPYARLVGFQDSSEFLKRIDLFSMSSVREGLPLALLEAMAHGLPIAATRVGGISEAIGDGVSGLLSSPGDPAELAANLTRLARDGALRAAIARSAKGRARESYSIESVARRYADLYCSTLGEAH